MMFFPSVAVNNCDTPFAHFNVTFLSELYLTSCITVMLQEYMHSYVSLFWLCRHWRCLLSFFSNATVKVKKGGSACHAWSQMLFCLPW